MEDKQKIISEYHKKLAEKSWQSRIRGKTKKGIKEMMAKAGRANKGRKKRKVMHIEHTA